MFYSLTSIILSRFILDLRSVYHTTHNISQSDSKQSSVCFASALEGNMGAALNASWRSSRDHNEEEAEGLQYSGYPFMTVLSDFKEASGPENVEEVPQAG